MTAKLRDLIRNVRGCKTAAEERAVIAKECALIRTAFKEEDAGHRHRNVAKLLFIHMLGYPSHFGQMECVKLIASPLFPEKRIGYLGLMLLLTEKEEVLTLVTNSMKNDLNHTNQLVVGLALSAFGNIASEDMARDLAPDIERLLQSDREYVRKKACLAAIRMLRKVPELVEDFEDRISSMLKERNHGVLLTIIQLMIDVVQIEPTVVRKWAGKVPVLVRILRRVLSMGYSSEYDVAGITDPFLQVKILRLLQLLGRSSPEATDAMNDLLAQVATNTETAKNAGNAILYECVNTIMATESDSGLRVLAVNILGRFLLNRDNNIRYVALNTLSRVVVNDFTSVQRHRNTIVECLKDPDTSIRQRALELIYALVNESNIRVLAREMLNYLVVCPVDQKEELCSKIADVVDRYAPSARWHVDTLITMLSISGGNIESDRVASQLILLIQQTPELHPYVVHKLWWALKEDLSQAGLVHVAVWCVGEYAEDLLRAPPAEEEILEDKPAPQAVEVVDLLRKVLRRSDSSEITKLYVLNAMLKLTTYVNDETQVARLKKTISGFKQSIALELQQRSVEYMHLLDDNLGSIRGEVLLKMPVPDKDIIQARRSRTESRQSDGEYRNSFGNQREDSDRAALVESKQSPQKDLLDLDDIFGGSGGASNGGVKSEKLPTKSDSDLLSDIFSPGGASQGPHANTLSENQSHQSNAPEHSQINASNDLVDIGLGASFNDKASAAAEIPTISVMDKDGFNIALRIEKDEIGGDGSSVITVIFTNNTAIEITDLLFQAAFPKYVQLQMEPPSSTTVPANGNGQVTQVVRVTNTMVGQKPLMMKVRLQFTRSGERLTEMTQVSNFPRGT